MAAAVERGELDAGPLPIAEVFRLGDKVRSLGNLGVSSDGPAMSVFLFSNRPVEDLSGSQIAVTSHTATSIQLLRVLFSELWGVSGHEFVEMSAASHDAALWIGDPALKRRNSSEYQYQYDLGAAWKSLTGLPFVFAEWVVRTDAPVAQVEEFERQLVAATRNGLDSIAEISRIQATEKMSEDEVTSYVKNFSYLFGSAERAGQLEFQQRLSKLPEWRPTAPAPAEPSAKKVISAS
jgi:chorismate dehydratase